MKGAEGSAGLMRFVQLDLRDAVTSATDGAVARRLVRVIAGNPVAMAKMTRYLGDVGSYAPVAILVEDTADGTRVAYDTVSSALAIYPGGKAAMLTAQALDAEILALLRRDPGLNPMAPGDRDRCQVDQPGRLSGQPRLAISPRAEIHSVWVFSRSPWRASIPSTMSSTLSRSFATRLKSRRYC